MSPPQHPPTHLRNRVLWGVELLQSPMIHWFLHSSQPSGNGFVTWREKTLRWDSESSSRQSLCSLASSSLEAPTQIEKKLAKPNARPPVVQCTSSYSPTHDPQSQMHALLQTSACPPAAQCASTQCMSSCRLIHSHPAAQCVSP